MIIYLYVKTHLTTGLKYLGKTIQDPYKYKGSGIYWNRHLKTHGYNVKTEILKECSNNEEVKYWGTYYSKLWNIVESNEWANLTEEQGDGNIPSKEIRKRISESSKGRTSWRKGKKFEDLYTPEKVIEIKKAIVRTGPQKPEVVAARAAKLKGRKHSPERIQNQVNSRKNGKGWNCSEDTRQLFRNAMKRRKESGYIPYNRGKKFPDLHSTAKYWIIIHPNGMREEIFSLKTWAENNSLNYKSLHAYFKRNKPYKGYTFIEKL